MYNLGMGMGMGMGITMREWEGMGMSKCGKIPEPQDSHIVRVHNGYFCCKIDHSLKLTI